MRRVHLRWPSLGFWIFSGSWTAFAALLLWGLTEPDLVQAWRILQRMEEPGFSGVSPGELHALSRSLDYHPTLIDALSGDRIADFVEPTEQKWIAYRQAHLAVRPQPDATIRIWTESRAHPSAYPLTVNFSAGWMEQNLVFQEDGRQSFDLPPGQPARAALVRVSVAPTGDLAEDSHPFEINVSGEAVKAGEGAP